jgi:hypothetical protein
MTHEQFLQHEEDCDRLQGYAEVNRTRELLELADRCLLGQMVQDGDPPDGVNVLFASKASCDSENCPCHDYPQVTSMSMDGP